MSASKKITGHLGKNKVKFELVEHKKVYTAYDLAQTLGHKLDGIAKTLLVHADIPEVQKKGKLHYVIVVPASYNIDLTKVKKLLKAKKVDFVKEKAIAKLGVKPGAISPFGSARGFGVVMDKALLKTKDILVGAESFTESVRMKVKDLVAIEAPIVGVIGKKNKLKLQKKAAPKKKSKKGKGPKKK
ncbi:aminoacyl-tRNA deacylase, partial [Patescibacteria group bacterium]